MASNHKSESIEPLKPISEDVGSNVLNLSECSDEFLKDVADGIVDLREVAKKELQKRNS